ncbi:hypothetical protein G5B35_08310 [Parapusillimonas sp. SGNA-6]|nr:hypothetical protein [Parapusillimonas sp. SGNA-6]
MRNRPTGEELLATARCTLLDELLPLLPADKSYEALMIANAMAIAARELTRCHDDVAPADEPIARFFRETGLDRDNDADEQALARLIRCRAIDARHASRLFELLLTLTRDKLALSNPKYLPPEAAHGKQVSDRSR